MQLTCIDFREEAGNARIARWALELENFTYKVVHRSGSSFSRCQVATVDINEMDSQIQVAQERDENIRKLREQLEREVAKSFDLKEGLLYRVEENDRNALYIPKDIVIRPILEKIGHQGLYKSCRTNLLVL